MLEQLQAIRAEMARMGEDMRGLRTEMVSVRHHVRGLELSQDADHDAIASVKARLDRIEKRLELAD